MRRRKTGGGVFGCIGNVVVITLPQLFHVSFTQPGSLRRGRGWARRESRDGNVFFFEKKN